MLNIIKRLCNTGLTESEYNEIYEDLQISNRKRLCIFSIISSAILFLMIIIAFIGSVVFNDWVAYRNLLTYIITFVLVVGIFLYAKYSKKNILPAMYFFSGIILTFGIIIGTISNPENTSGSYFALLLAVPMLFVDKPIRSDVMIIISNIIYIPMAIFLKPQSTWQSDLINGIVFGIISIIISSFMMKIKLSEFKNIKLISRLANLDTMTGVFNRNNYEQKLKEFNPAGAQNCFCIYADANGLHELNNVKGHGAGDEMLIFIAKTLRESFEDSDVFRLGGDEFMVFGVNKTEHQINNIVDEAHKKIMSAGYSVSIGLVYQEYASSNMESIVKCAETKMLKNKQQHYEQMGIDRRYSLHV